LETAMARSSNADELQDMINRGVVGVGSGATRTGVPARK
jgi:hypothetical protein